MGSYSGKSGAHEKQLDQSNERDWHFRGSVRIVSTCIAYFRMRFVYSVQPFTNI